MTLKAGVYKSSKGNTVVVAEDGRNLYSLYDGKNFGTREKWPVKYKTFSEFVDGQKMIRVKDWDGVFF